MSNFKFAAALAAVSTMPLAIPAAAQDWSPRRPVEFVAAAGPGGGTDTFARVIQSALSEGGLLDRPIIVSNKSGGSGAEAFLYARANGEDPHKLFFGTQDAYVLPLTNQLSYSRDDLTAVAAMTFDPFILWTNPEATGIDSVEAFVAQARETPNAIKVGGAKAKEADETLVSLIENTAGVELSYVPFRSGSEAAIQVAGGHIHANVNNPIESVEQWRAGIQKPLCVFEDERLANTDVIADDMAWSDIPTCTEAGLAIGSFAQPRTVWAPKDIPAEALAYYQDLFRQVASGPVFTDYVRRGAQIARVLTGEELEAFLVEHQETYSAIYERNGWLVATN